jgi:bifunctional DNA-binding transcriptional regulator/antitoxin component of YhaV-PrlF toxin-antitoxin module
MTFRHDEAKRMKTDICHLTERGQVSFPASLRRQMQLKPGQRLRWEAVSANEARIFVEPDEKPDPEKALGYGARLRGGQPRRTAEWLRELRAGE